jgi:hypothetical protein
MEQVFMEQGLWNQRIKTNALRRRHQDEGINKPEGTRRQQQLRQTKYRGEVLAEITPA